MYGLIMLILAPATFGLVREKTTSYYGYVYGSNGVYCACKIGPCGYDDLLGEKTVYCDGSSSSWGITEGCFTRTEITYGDYCYAEAAMAPADQAACTSDVASHAEAAACSD
jgi:hypothetical protein